MDKIIITAKTYDDAVTKALIELGTTQDNLDITVLENGSSGLFGIFGAKPCKIEVSVIEKVDDFELLKRENKLHSEQLLHALNKKPETEKAKGLKPSAIREEKKADVPDKGLDRQKKDGKIVSGQRYITERQEKSLKSVKTVSLAKQEDGYSSAFAEEVKTTNLSPLSEEETAHIVNSAKDFVEKLLKTMGFEIQITSEFDHMTNEIYMLINSEDDMGIVIGKHGQTLDSIQYITSLVVNKSTSQYIRVKLDAQGYRSKRKDKLESLANSVALKVKRFKKPISLEPMNPYERRIIHSALQSHPYITTKSEGEEPNRFITILLKNSFSKNRFNKNQKFRKPQDRGFRATIDNQEVQE